jgi:putative acetyltransferase
MLNRNVPYYSLYKIYSHLKLEKKLVRLINIRKADIDDFSVLSEIWLEASLIAHHFIPEAYWKENKLKMQHVYLPMSEVYLAEYHHQIYGFIALLDHKLAAIFVSPSHQGKGVGTALIQYAQAIRTELELNVYQENPQSVQFYKTLGFEVVEEGIDFETNSKEFLMRWVK